LENSENRQQHYHHGNQQKAIRWPFIRVFSLDRKSYAFVDIRDTKAHEFQEDAIESLVLPDKMLGLLSTVFRSDSRKLFGDLIAGKHGGMIILANGPSGVGKTMTAETYAETMGRPLYVMEIGELGVSLKEVEENLQRVFARATRWNAVLLMDEADVFMAERGDDLERAAIVGVFLRLLDYYPGLLFLTSNRANVIDRAFQSRITLKLDYPQLDADRRRKVWARMLKAAELGCDDLDGVPDIEVNGRQIRNLTRLLKVLYESEGKVTAEQIKDVTQFACTG